MKKNIAYFSKLLKPFQSVNNDKKLVYLRFHFIDFVYND